MDLDHFPDRFAKNRMAERYKSHRYLELRYGEFDVFTSARFRESHLESGHKDNLDQGKGAFDVLCLYYKGAHVGSLSFFLEKNEMREEEADHFARVDIVIVESGYRKKGIARLLVLSAIQYLLDRWGAGIYSVSCLAAHEAIALILEEIGFQGEQRPDESFKRETISFGEVNQDEFSARVDARLTEMIPLVNYRLR